MNNVLEAADAVCSSARSMNPGVPIGQSDVVVSGDKLMALHCALRESASGSVVSGSGETVACEPGGDPPPPPPARTNAEKFWASLMPQQAFDLLKAAPRKLAGPWGKTEGTYSRARISPTGYVVAGYDSDVFCLNVGACANFASAAEADAALRKLGWILVD